MATAGVKFEQFTGDDIESYLDRLDQHFIALDLDGEDQTKVKKRKAVFLSSMGAESYRVVKDLCYPDDPESHTYAQLTAHLKSFYAPKKLSVAERYKFHTTVQQSGQTISEYSAHLKKIASTCDFGNDLQTNLRDRFICGLQSESLKKKLLSEELTFQQALDRAIAAEAETNNVKDMTTTKTVHKLHKTSKGHQGSSTRPNPSHRTGLSHKESRVKV